MRTLDRRSGIVNRGGDRIGVHAVEANRDLIWGSVGGIAGFWQHAREKETPQVQGASLLRTSVKSRRLHCRGRVQNRTVKAWSFVLCLLLSRLGVGGTDLESGRKVPKAQNFLAPVARVILHDAGGVRTGCQLEGTLQDLALVLVIIRTTEGVSHGMVYEQ